MSAILEHNRLMAWPAAESIMLVVTDGARYNDAVRQVADALTRRFQSGVYLTANRPFHALRDGLKAGGVDTSRHMFIDCVSSLTGIMPASEPQVVHVESPTMLEKAAMRAEQQLRRQAAGNRFLILDSLSSLCVYNGNAPVAELAHNLITRLRLQRIPAALILVERQAGEDLLDIVRPLCDGVVHL